MDLLRPVEKVLLAIPIRSSDYVVAKVLDRLECESSGPLLLVQPLCLAILLVFRYYLWCLALFGVGCDPQSGCKLVQDVRQAQLYPFCLLLHPLSASAILECFSVCYVFFLGFLRLFCLFL